VRIAVNRCGQVHPIRENTDLLRGTAFYALSGLGAAMEVTVLGTSDFTDATRAFDGVRSMYDTKAVNVVVSGVHPTQGGFNIRAGNTITDKVYEGRYAWIRSMKRVRAA
jgi:hypothetical protein